MSWWQYRDRVTVIDVLESGACYSGVRDWVSANGVIAGDPTEFTDDEIRTASQGYGYGDGVDGNGYGGVDGNGYGDGYGYGYGNGDGYGYGYGNGYGYGDGYGYGYGYGYGNGGGYGSGDRYGDE